MQTTYADRSIRYAESKAENIEQYLADHREAMECLDVEILIKDSVELLENVLAIDTFVQTLYCQGAEYNPAFEERLDVVLKRWLELASVVFEKANKFENLGYTVKGTDRLQQELIEVRAMLNPSSELSGELLILRDQAIADSNSGNVLDGFCDHVS
jgi:hypothetical protein